MDNSTSKTRAHAARLVAAGLLAAMVALAVAVLPQPTAGDAPLAGVQQAQAKAKAKSKPKVKLTSKKLRVTGCKSYYVYTGKKIKPTVKVYFKKSGAYKKLKAGRDYKVAFANNKKGGKATISITGKGSYKGTVKKTFKIRYDLAKSGHVTLKYSSYLYADGAAVTPAPTVLYGKKKLVAGTDYTLSYSGNKSVGTATVTAKGKGYYLGKAMAQFRVALDTSRNLKVALSAKSYRYTGYAHVPDVTVTGYKPKALIQAHDEAATAAAQAQAEAAANAQQAADAAPAEGADAAGAQEATRDEEPFALTSKQVKAVIAQIDAEGAAPKVKKAELVEGEDYKVKVKNNADVGTATVTVTGKGWFAGSSTVVHFTVKEPSTKIIDVSYWDGDIDWGKVAPQVSTVFMRAFRTSQSHVGYADRDKSGMMIQDVKYDEYASGCERYNIPYSAYGYMIFSNAKDTAQDALADARVQAERLCDAAFSNGHRPVSIILDLEDDIMATRNSAFVKDCTQVAIECIQRRAVQVGYANGIKLGLYIGARGYATFGFATEAGEQLVASEVDFRWVPRYGKNTGDVPEAKYRPDRVYDLWQYTSAGKIEGIDGKVDISLVNPEGPNTRTIDWYLKP